MKITVTKSLTQLRSAARARINRDAAAERAKSVTAGKANIYAAKRAEAERWLAKREGLPPVRLKLEITATDLVGFPFLIAEMQATGMSADAVATLWRDKAVQYETIIAPAIEGREMKAKTAIAAATTPAQLAAVKF